MHPVVKSLLVDMRVYKPVTTSPYTADEIDYNSNKSETSSFEEQKYIGSFLFFQQLGRVLNLENYVTQLRILYLTAQVSIVALSYLLIHKIRQKNDQTVLKYVEPAAQNWDGTETGDQLVNTTVMDYDIADVHKTLKQSAMGILLISFLHFKMGYVQPLLAQSILGFKTFLMTKEVRIHFWGFPTTGDLRRPFRLEAPFGMVSEKKQPRTDKGSIKKAEKALKAE